MELSETEWPIDGTAPAFIGRNHATTAVLNRWQTFTLISRSQCVSQLQLARTTGLRTSTTSNIIRDLKELNLIRDTGPLATKRVGPKEGGLEVNPEAAWAIGLQLDPQRHEIGLVNAAGHVMARQSFPPGLPWQEVIASVPATVDRLTGVANANPARCAGMGVSVAGIVDSAKGTVLYSRPLNMRNEHILPALEALDVGPVCIERDVNCGACAEQQVGAARQQRTFLFYLIRPNSAGAYQFGLSLILNGRIFHGLSSASGELDRLLAPDYPSPTSSDEAHDLFYRECGIRLASIVNLLDINRVVMAGDDPQFTEARLAKLQEQVDQLAIPVPGRTIHITRAQLGVAGILQGAAFLATSRYLRGLLFSEAQGSSRALRK